MAAFDRASSAPPCVSLLSPRVRPGVFFQFLAGSGARGAADGEEGDAPTTRPGPENASGSFEEREQMLPIVLEDYGGGVTEWNSACSYGD